MHAEDWLPSVNDLYPKIDAAVKRRLADPNMYNFLSKSISNGCVHMFGVNILLRILFNVVKFV